MTWTCETVPTKVTAWVNSDGSFTMNVNGTVIALGPTETDNLRNYLNEKLAKVGV